METRQDPVSPPNRRPWPLRQRWWVYVVIGVPVAWGVILLLQAVQPPESRLIERAARAQLKERGADVASVSCRETRYIYTGDEDRCHVVLVGGRAFDSVAHVVNVRRTKGVVRSSTVRFAFPADLPHGP